MGFFSKKEKVPDLPPAPLLPELPNPYEMEEKVEKDLPELPFFPKENEEKFDMSKGTAESTIPILPKRSMENMDFPKKRVLELNAEIESKPVIKPLEPIYVRIDRFQSSKKNFEKIKEKVTEVEKVLRKIKDVKMREEKELDEWSMEIEKLKSRISEIDSDLFSQL